MNRYKKIKTYVFVGIISTLSSTPTLYADSGWRYQQQSDDLNNQTYSVAQSPLPKPGLYDNIMLSLVCKDHTLQSVIETDDLIASQGSHFTLEYQIDKQAPVTLTLKTFPDSKRKGYTETDAKQMAEALLSGQAVFIKVNTMIKTVLSISINLDNASTPIKKVLEDCASLTSSQQTPSTNNYSFKDFEADFKQLTANQQQKILPQLKQLISNKQQSIN